MTPEESAQHAALCVQLEELNNRSRFYSSQAWQVPFAYLALAAISVASVAEHRAHFLPLALVGAALLGSWVAVHLRYVRNGIERAVEHTKTVEDDLGLNRTVIFDEKYWRWFPSLVYGSIFMWLALAFLALI